MTIAQAEKFYAQNKKEYDLAKNKEFLIWLKKATKNGYHAYIDVEELQRFIDEIVYWYEIKYPNRELKLASGISDERFENIEPLSKVMTLEQLKYRLTHHQLLLLKSDYRGKGLRYRKIFNESNGLNEERKIFDICILKKWITPDIYWELPYFILNVDAENGIIYGESDSKEFLSIDKITLDRLLPSLKFDDSLDLTEIEQCIYNHNCDIELRRRILQLTALKILYSYRTVPEYGYERAKRFIEEFNTELGLNLSTEEIDEAFSPSKPKEITEDKIKRFPSLFGIRQKH